MKSQEVSDVEVQKSISQNEARENAVLETVNRVGGIAMSGTSREYLATLSLEGEMSETEFDTAVASLKMKGKVSAPLVSYSSPTTQYVSLELTRPIELLR